MMLKVEVGTTISKQHDYSKFVKFLHTSYAKKLEEKLGCTSIAATDALSGACWPRKIPWNRQNWPERSQKLVVAGWPGMVGDPTFGHLTGYSIK